MELYFTTNDENGNTLAPGALAGVTCRVEAGVTYKQSYNADNRITAIHKMSGSCAMGTSTESWLYAYDGDGTRVSTAHFTGANTNPDSFTRYYFGGAVETTGGTAKKYYSFAVQTVAMKDNGVFKYFLTDHLGSTSVVLSAAGAILEQQRYLPFGAPRPVAPYANVTSTDFTYTGQRALPNTGLMDYKARFYSPSLGRFIQPDSLVAGPANPQTWNRYSYVINNPIKFNDPTGHLQEGGGHGGCDTPLECGMGMKHRSHPSTKPVKKPTPKIAPTPTLNPTLSSMLTTSPTGNLPTLAPRYVDGPTITSTPTPTLTPTPTTTPIPKSKMDVDEIANGINQGSDITDTLITVKNGVQPPTWLDVFLSVGTQVFEDSNNNYNWKQETLRIGVATVESIIKVGLVGSITLGVFVGLGGLVDPIAYIGAGAALYASSRLTNNLFNYVNDKVIYPAIDEIH